MIENTWIVHGLECDDGHKLPPMELVLKSELDDERKSNDALMKLLSDEKFKNERLADILVRIATSSYQCQETAAGLARSAFETGGDAK